jgi:hypothetical protein
MVYLLGGIILGAVASMVSVSMLKKKGAAYKANRGKESPLETLMNLDDEKVA